ncbi:hypothetical protein MKX01_034938 [Papaver californicum]|nr:hypothetical protein MKX01_034938 [Papaver californicum]
MCVELDHPLILIHDKKISDVASLVKILELAVTKNRPLLIHRAGVKACAIKSPGFGENRRANLEDLAVLTRGQLITEDQGLKLDKVQLEMLGTAKKITVSLDDTIILHGGGDKKLIEERCEQLRISLENSSTMFDKEKAQERLSKLSGGVVVFKVGGASEAEVGGKKDRATDALNATKAAVDSSRWWCALLFSSRVLDNLQTLNNDQKRRHLHLRYLKMLV